MRKTFLIFGLVLGLVLSWNAVCAAEGVVVIPLLGDEPAHAPVEKTGQTGCWDSSGSAIPCAGTGQDGEYEKGVAWPTPRFTDNSNGTVTDNLTGLIWLKLLDCPFGNWQSLLDFCNALASGTCGLIDGSKAGDWRLANRFELLSLLDHSQHGPILPPGHPFSVSKFANFISSTTAVDITTAAWIVSIYDGASGTGLKTGNWNGACVRGGR